MTVLEFWGCSLITFGPPLAMFTLTVANDPIKVILLILSSFFWLLSFLTGAILWSMIRQFCDYLIIGAVLAVLSQEVFRYAFHSATKKGQIFLSNVLSQCLDESKPRKQRTNQIEIVSKNLPELYDRIPISYVSGLGFGLMNGVFSMLNVLTDYIGPGTVGLKGDSHYFLLVSSMTTLAFILLNVAWSILMSESVEKSDKRLAMLVLVAHLAATSISFLNGLHLQLLSILVIYSITFFCGLGAFQVAGFDLNLLIRRGRATTATTTTAATTSQVQS